MAGISPKLPIRRDSEDGYALTKTPIEAILQNLKNLMLTVPGERMMDPLFGVGLNRYLFDMHTPRTYEKIYTRTLNQVSKYMPFIRIDDMLFYGPDGMWSPDGEQPAFVPGADPNLLQVKISLTILPLSRKVSLHLVL